MKYAAFLRGINVGGHKLIKMAELKKIFESLKFENVKTLLASGNVVFETSEEKTEKVQQKISKGLEQALGYAVGVILRTLPELEKLVHCEPFKGITVTPQTRLYITFLGEEKKSSLKIPYTSETGDFRILAVHKGVIISVLIVSPESRSVDLMNIVEKEFGKNVTTRNWNTLLKIIKS